jgi:hypothetical protein
VKYYANEYMNSQKRYDYVMIEFVSDDGNIATCPARILGFVWYTITLSIPTPQFTGEEELTLNTIQENMAVDNNLYVVVHTASDYVSSEQMEKKFVSYLSLEMLWIACTLSRLKQFMDHCLSLGIMVPLVKMQTNFSAPCHKGDGDNTLATRYNHKIILVDDAYWLFS